MDILYDMVPPNPNENNVPKNLESLCFIMHQVFWNIKTSYIRIRSIYIHKVYVLPPTEQPPRMSNMLDTQNTAPEPDEPEASNPGGATATAAAQSPYYRSEGGRGK